MTASEPADSTVSSTLLWNASFGNPVSSSTFVQSLYSLSDHSPSFSSSRIVSQQRIPAPPVCSQNPGLSLVCPDARPFAIAFAAPSWSEASAVSACAMSIISHYVAVERSRTYNNIRFFDFFYEYSRVVEVSNYNLDVREGLLDSFGFLFYRFVNTGCC